MVQGGLAPSLDSAPPAVREQLVKRFDEDKDGKLNEKELAAAQAEMMRRREERMGRGGPERGAGSAMAKDAAPTDKAEEAEVSKVMEAFAPKAEGVRK